MYSPKSKICHLITIQPWNLKYFSILYQHKTNQIPILVNKGTPTKCKKYILINEELKYVTYSFKETYSTPLR